MRKELFGFLLISILLSACYKDRPLYSFDDFLGVYEMGCTYSFIERREGAVTVNQTENYYVEVLITESSINYQYRITVDSVTGCFDTLEAGIYDFAQSIPHNPYVYPDKPELNNFTFSPSVVNNNQANSYDYSPWNFELSLKEKTAINIAYSTYYGHGYSVYQQGQFIHISTTETCNCSGEKRE